MTACRRLAPEQRPARTTHQHEPPARLPIRLDPDHRRFRACQADQRRAHTEENPMPAHADAMADRQRRQQKQRRPGGAATRTPPPSREQAGQAGSACARGLTVPLSVEPLPGSSAADGGSSGSSFGRWPHTSIYGRLRQYQARPLRPRPKSAWWRSTARPVDTGCHQWYFTPALQTEPLLILSFLAGRKPMALDISTASEFLRQQGRRRRHGVARQGQGSQRGLLLQDFRRTAGAPGPPT